MIVIIAIGIAAGTAADYWGLNSYIKYTLMAVAIAATQRILNGKRGQEE
ncbi:hypothetical protein [Pseudomonas hunanensis]